jgi:hypothetical protein
MDYETRDCRRVLVGTQPGGMVELVIDPGPGQDQVHVTVPAAEARGLAMKLVIQATLAGNPERISR